MSSWRFQVLGPLEVRHDGVPLALGGPKQRSVLALLLLEAGHLVPTSRLIEHVWGPGGADGAPASLQVYVSSLRKILREAGSGTTERVSYVRPGYRLRVEPGELDLHEVDDVLSQARERRAAGDPAAASHLLRLGLSMWRGRALADLADLPGLAPLLVGVDRRRDVLRHECYDVELELGRHLALVPELEAAVADAPLDERLAGQHMLALYRSGRQADALVAFRRTSDLLSESLGIDPGLSLRTLHEAILRQDIALDPSATATDVATTMTQDGRGLRGATVTLPNGVALELGSRTWVIGRHPGCDIVLSDPQVSRRHADLRPVIGGYDLVDLGSSNGTRVDDADVTRRRLADGDRIQVGDTELVLHLPPTVSP
ncbi:MAG TPA: BTAD domain-containing putative transcriptional regulator [Candidatus Nanopelagicales bacterium]